MWGKIKSVIHATAQFKNTKCEILKSPVIIISNTINITRFR